MPEDREFTVRDYVTFKAGQRYDILQIRPWNNGLGLHYRITVKLKETWIKQIQYL